MLRQHKRLVQAHPVHGIQPGQTQFHHGKALALAAEHAQPRIHQLLALGRALGIRRLDQEEEREI